MPPSISKYAIQKVTSRSALRRRQRREREMNQQQAEDSSAPTNDIDSSNNRLSQIPTETGEACQQIRPSSSILDVNDNNTGVTDINNNTNDTIHGDETSSTLVETEPPTRMKPSQQLEL